MSDIDQSGISGRIIWKNWDNGNYEIPFGRNGKYLPVKFSNVVAHASEIIIGSQQTNKNNLPCPFTNGLLSEENFSVSKVIDRWWTIQAPGVTADVSFTYSGDENISTSPVGTVSIMQWNGTSWEKLSNSPAGNNVANAQEVSNFSRFIIVKDDEGPFSQETPEQERASVTSPDKSAELKIISVSPNPFTTTLNVDYTTKTKSTFILTDASGRTVRQFEATLAETSKTANLTGLEDLKKGIYFLSIAGDGKKDTVKLIKND
jgi:hypothetical protein